MIYDKALQIASAMPMTALSTTPGLSLSVGPALGTANTVKLSSLQSATLNGEPMCLVVDWVTALAGGGGDLTFQYTFTMDAAGTMASNTPVGGSREYAASDCTAGAQHIVVLPPIPQAQGNYYIGVAVTTSSGTTNYSAGSINAHFMPYSMALQLRANKTYPTNLPIWL